MPKNTQNRNNGRDLYPQWLNLTQVTGNGSNFVSSETKTPVFGDTVMEILGVETSMNRDSLVSDNAASPDSSRNPRLHVSTKELTADTELNDPSIIHKRAPLAESQYAEASETGGAGMGVWEKVKYQSYTEGGKGFLCAAQSLHLGIVDSDPNMAHVQSARVLHRLVKVSAKELVGLTRQ